VRRSERSAAGLGAGRGEGRPEPSLQGPQDRAVSRRANEGSRGWRGEGRPEPSLQGPQDRAVSRRRTESNGHGFTLIEVLAALLIVSLVFGLLLESVTHNLADLSRARAEARGAQLAENKMRDLRADLEVGQEIKDGITEGVFDAPDNDLHWQIAIMPQSLVLPPDYKGELPPSPLFKVTGGPQPATASSDKDKEPLRMVEVRVFGENTDPNTVEPFVILLTSKPDDSQLQQLQQGQNGQGQPGQPGLPGQQRNGTTPQTGTQGMGSNTGRFQ
jgi:prepilin-type N-terminal cleavage/methylation domain-containing protein